MKWRKGEEYVPTYPKVRDSPGKLGVIPDDLSVVKTSVALGAGNALSGSW